MEKRKKYSYTYLIQFLLLLVIAVVQPAISSPAVRVVLVVLFQWIILLNVAVLIVRAVRRWMRELEFNVSNCRAFLITAGGCAAAGLLFFLLFNLYERDIKVYDTVYYWRTLVEDRAIMETSLHEYFTHLLNTFGQEYTSLPVFLLVPVSYLTGTGYAGYCISIFLLYYLPACLLLTLFGLRLVKQMKTGDGALHNLTIVMSLILCVSGVSFLWPVTYGYVDVIGVLIISVMLHETLDWQYTTITWKKDLMLALLSLLLLLSRRWYAYYIVGFYVSFGVDLIIKMAVKRKVLYKELACYLANLLMIAGVSSYLILSLNRRIFTQFLFRDYATAYVAYKTESLFMNLWTIIKEMSGFLFIAALGGAYLLAGNKKTRPVLIRLVTAAAVSVILFSTVQNLARHHFYLLLPMVFICVCVACEFAVWLMKTQEKPILVGALLTLCVVNFAYAYIPAVQDFAYSSQPLTTALHSFPKVMDNYDAVGQLVTDLQAKITGNHQSVYVIGEGESLSPELLKRSKMPETVDAAPFVLTNSIVDMRDGFPSPLFMADYVLLVSPYQQTFMETQQVSLQAYEMFRLDKIVAEYYTVDEKYEYGDSYYLLYKRIKPVDTVLINHLKARLQTVSPDAPFVYEPNYFLALSRFNEQAEYTYNFWEKSFLMRKYEDVPLEITLDLQGDTKFHTLSFDLSCWTDEYELVIANQDGELYRTPISNAEHQRYTWDISGSEALKLAVEPIGTVDDYDDTIIINVQDDSLK